MLFCRLYTGDAHVATDMTTRALEEYFSTKKPLHLDHVPPTLLSFAFEECNTQANGTSTGADIQSEFEWAVVSLKPAERAVFILHGVLDLWLPWVAAITGIPFDTVYQLWSSALINLRVAIVRDESSQLFADGPTLLQPPSEAFA
jgi:hypothetical protein